MVMENISTKKNSSNCWFYWSVHVLRENTSRENDQMEIGEAFISALYEQAPGAAMAEVSFYP